MAAALVPGQKRPRPKRRRDRCCDDDCSEFTAATARLFVVLHCAHLVGGDDFAGYCQTPSIRIYDVCKEQLFTPMLFLAYSSFSLRDRLMKN